MYINVSETYFKVDLKVKKKQNRKKTNKNNKHSSKCANIQSARG